MMKKWMVVFMVLCLTLFLWGCGKSNNAGGETSVLDGGAGKALRVVLLDVC